MVYKSLVVNLIGQRSQDLSVSRDIIGSLAMVLPLIKDRPGIKCIDSPLKLNRQNILFS